MITLEDLKDYSEQDILKHLVENYAGTKSGYDYGNITDKDKIIAQKALENMEVLIAYESVGNWGCDSSSFFLLKDKINNKLFVINGSHNSFFGFEGQLFEDVINYKLEEVDIITLKYIINNNYDHSVFCTGGYDENDAENKRIVSEYILNL